MSPLGPLFILLTDELFERVESPIDRRAFLNILQQLAEQSNNDKILEKLVPKRFRQWTGYPGRS